LQSPSSVRHVVSVLGGALFLFVFLIPVLAKTEIVLERLGVAESLRRLVQRMRQISSWLSTNWQCG